MTEKHFLIVGPHSQRLDHFLVWRLPHLTRGRLQKMIREGWVTVSDHVGKQAMRLKPGDQVQVIVPAPESMELIAEEIPLEVVYQDSDLMVVEKPAGLTVHPGAGHPRHTLVNALLAMSDNLSGIGGELRPGIVHRLDKDTSGLMVVVKNDTAHRGLARQLKGRSIIKKYLALVMGTPQPSEGLIEAFLGRDPFHRKRMAVVSDGREAVTSYKVQEVMGRFALLEVSPTTGRTHQIRVHLAYIGHPIVGDRLYNRRRVHFLERQFLHASFLAFQHPITGKSLEFTSPLPEDLEQALVVART